MTARPNLPWRRVVLFVLFATSCTFLASLGVWQLHRAETKRERYTEFSLRLGAPPVDLANLPADYRADDYRWRRVELRGEYRAPDVLLDNRVQQGRPGYEVITPLATPAGKLMLVDRGWTALGPSREALPAAPAPDGPVLLTGFLGEPPVTGVAINADAGRIEQLSPDMLRVQQIDSAALAPLLGQRPRPGILYLDADAPGALAVDWTLPGDGSARHVAYAVQWFAMAIVLAGIGVWNWRRTRTSHE